MIGTRGSLAAVLLVASLVVGPGTRSQEAAGTWTDPPTRESPAAAPPGPEAAPKSVAVEPVPPAEARTDGTDSTIRGAARSVAPRSAGRAKRIARAPRREVARTRVVERAPKPHRTRARAASRIRDEASPPRTVVASHARQPAGPRPYAAEPGYAYGPAYAYNADDQRLDRLESAARAGYIVMRRRSVEFPDGRSLRVYRPYEDDGPF